MRKHQLDALLRLASKTDHDISVAHSGGSGKKAVLQVQADTRTLIDYLMHEQNLATPKHPFGDGPQAA